MRMAGSLDGSDAEEWNAMCALLQTSPFPLPLGSFVENVELEMLWNAGVRFVDFHAAIELAKERKGSIFDAWGFIRTVAFNRAARSRVADLTLGRAPYPFLLASAVTKPWKESE